MLNIASLVSCKCIILLFSLARCDDQNKKESMSVSIGDISKVSYTNEVGATSETTFTECQNRSIRSVSIDSDKIEREQKVSHTGGDSCYWGAPICEDSSQTPVFEKMKICAWVNQKT